MFALRSNSDGKVDGYDRSYMRQLMQIDNADCLQDVDEAKWNEDWGPWLEIG